MYFFLRIIIFTYNYEHLNKDGNLYLIPNAGLLKSQFLTFLPGSIPGTVIDKSVGAHKILELN